MQERSAGIIVLNMEQSVEMKLSVVGYDPISYWKKDAASVEELLEYRNPSGVTWINVTGFGDHAFLTQLTETLHIHPLTLEDILVTDQRPKVEEFDDYLFCSMKVVSWEDNAPQFEQISFIVNSDNTLVSFQEHPHLLFCMI